MRDSNMFNGNRVVDHGQLLRIAAEQVVADYRAVQSSLINPKLLGMSIDKMDRILKEISK